jgi:hypothetical protein
MGYAQQASDWLLGSAKQTESQANTTADGPGNAATSAQQQRASYTVQPGDSVSSIARRGTGDAMRYVELNLFNGRDPQATDLEVGDCLDIPAAGDWELPALGVVASPVGETTEPEPEVQATEEEGWVDWARGGVEDAADTAKDAWNRGWDAAEDVGDAVRDGWNEGVEWVGGLVPGGPEMAPGTPAAPATPELSPRETAQKKALDDGKTNNLDAAVDLADDLDMQHGYDGAVAGDLAGSSRRRAILRGDVDDLQTLLCSEFTAATLQAAGYDLTAHYMDPSSGDYIAYADGQKSDGTPEMTLVDIYMVVNAQPEATRSIMDAASGACEAVTQASERAQEIGGGNVPGDFHYCEELTFKDETASADHSFGAGAAAVALGGCEVALSERKPGDIQQWFTTLDGTYTAGGHSSTVYSVKGSGVALLGGANSPTIEGASSDLAPGWYEVPAGSALRWVIGPDTDPNAIASLMATDIQLIDANKRGVGNDATKVGSFEAQAEYSDTGGSKVTDAGRLPTSDWFAWTATDAPETTQQLDE